MNFLEELNFEINPILIAYIDNDVFKVRLRDTPFLDSACLNVSKQFIEVVYRVGKKHFCKIPTFNNTQTTWWF